MACGSASAAAMIFCRWLSPPERELQTRGWTIVGLDADGESLKRHRGLRHRILGTAEQLPVGDESVSLLTANMVLEHVEHPNRLFAEIRRVLRPGGRALIHTPNSDGYTTRLTMAIPESLVRPLAKGLLNRAAEDVYPTYYRANTEPALSAAAARAGLRVETCALIDSSPQFYRVPPLMLLELLFMRLVRVTRRDRHKPCLLVTLEKRADGR